MYLIAVTKKDVINKWSTKCKIKCFSYYITRIFQFIGGKQFLEIHALFYKQHYVSTQPQCCLTFSWIELQILLRYCLIKKDLHTETFFTSAVFDLLYSCPCLDLGLFMSYLCDLFFIFIFLLILINHYLTKKAHLVFFRHFLEYSYYSWMITWIKNVNIFQIAKVQSQVVA